MKNPLTERKLTFSVIRVPFFLEPNYDEDLPFIESNRERLLKKWGGHQGWERQKLHHNLKGRGQEAGIPHFNLDRLASNSMASHRLIQHIGKRYGLQVSEGLYDKLNVYYFVDGHALNDKPRLAEVAAEEITRLRGCDPMSKEEILDFLESDQGRAEIESALAALAQLGIHGIPKFIVGGSYIVDGAAHSDVFVKLFRQIEEEGNELGKPVFADILGIEPQLVQQGSHSFDKAFL